MAMGNVFPFWFLTEFYRSKFSHKSKKNPTLLKKKHFIDHNNLEFECYVTGAEMFYFRTRQQQHLLSGWEILSS